MISVVRHIHRGQAFLLAYLYCCGCVSVNRLLATGDPVYVGFIKVGGSLFVGQAKFDELGPALDLLLTIEAAEAYATLARRTA